MRFVIFILASFYVRLIKGNFGKVEVKFYHEIVTLVLLNKIHLYEHDISNRG